MRSNGELQTFATLPSADSIPAFASEEEERAFWSSHDTTAIFEQGEDVSSGPPADAFVRAPDERIRARKRPPTGHMDLVSIRFPAEMIDQLKLVAAEHHLPYQTLIRSWVGERLDQETRSTSRKPTVPA